MKAQGALEYLLLIGGADYFDGFIDEVGIWDRALTETDIEFLYNRRN